jgi:hypothetical protein
VHVRKGEGDVLGDVQEMQEHSAQAKVNQGQLGHDGYSQECGDRQVEVDSGCLVAQGPSVK